MNPITLVFPWEPQTLYVVCPAETVGRDGEWQTIRIPAFDQVVSFPRHAIPGDLPDAGFVSVGIQGDAIKVINLYTMMEDSAGV